MSDYIVMTESKLRKIVRESVYRVLDEIGGGIHQNGQIDLFMDQDEIGQYNGVSNNAMVDALLSAESKCGWEHNNAVPVRGGVKYECYCGDYRSTDVGTFINTLLKISPKPQNVKVVNHKYRAVPDEKRVTILLKNVVD